MKNFHLYAFPCTVALIALSGCALGSTRLGEKWSKDGASDQDRETVTAECTLRMQTQAAGEPPKFCPPILVPGHTACIVGTDIAARKEFSRACMTSQGWALK